MIYLLRISSFKCHILIIIIIMSFVWKYVFDTLISNGWDRNGDIVWYKYNFAHVIQNKRMNYISYLYNGHLFIHIRVCYMVLPT